MDTAFITEVILPIISALVLGYSALCSEILGDIDCYEILCLMRLVRCENCGPESQIAG